MSAANWWTSLISECKSLTGIENITNIWKKPRVDTIPPKASVLAYVSVMLFLILYIQGVVFF